MKRLEPAMKTNFIDETIKSTIVRSCAKLCAVVRSFSRWLWRHLYKNCSVKIALLAPATSRFEGWPFMGPICLVRNHSQIYPHMPAKFGHDCCRIASARLEIREIVRTRLL